MCHDFFWGGGCAQNPVKVATALPKNRCRQGFLAHLCPLWIETRHRSLYAGITAGEYDGQRFSASCVKARSARTGAGTGARTGANSKIYQYRSSLSTIISPLPLLFLEVWRTSPRNLTRKQPIFGNFWYSVYCIGHGFGEFNPRPCLSVWMPCYIFLTKVINNFLS